MGFLTINGMLLTYSEYFKLIEHYKIHGVMQFLKLYSIHKDRQIEPRDLHWGEEIEYHIYACNKESRTCQLSCDANDIIAQFKIKNELDLESLQNSETQEVRPNFNLMPEFGDWMIEAVPDKPYCTTACGQTLLSSHQKMVDRRAYLNKLFSDYSNGTLMLASMASSPIMGTPYSFTSQNSEILKLLEEAYQKPIVESNPKTESIFIPEFSASPHARFLGIANVIKERRTEKVKILSPLYMDENTSTEATEDEPYPGYIYMDCMHFGMGCSCLQITYETQCINHARYLYDALVPFTGVLAALSQACPFFKGKLSAHDLRFQVIEQSVDCRTPEERDPQNPQYLAKSRYSPVSHYISNHEFSLEKYNDTQILPIDFHIMEMLRKQGLDEKLAYHVAALFIRSPVPAYERELQFPEELNCFIEQLRAKQMAKSPTKVEGDKYGSEESKSEDTKSWWSLDRDQAREGIECCEKFFTKIPAIDGHSHFENLQSTNWNTLRFKNPPSADSKIGWRVEFRPLDIMLTDFENAAMTVVTGMVVNILNDFSLDFLLPISLSDENMLLAQEQDAIYKQKFWWRTDLFSQNHNYQTSTLKETNFLKSVNKDNQPTEKPAPKIEKVFLWQILEGDQTVGLDKGLIQLFNEYMEINKWKEEHKETINKYCTLLLKRAKGEIPSCARFIRDFVLNHPDYKKDSIVSNSITFDLMKMISLLELDTPESKELRAKLLGPGN